MLLDAFRRQHHAAVTARIPHHCTLDGESRLHLVDIKRLHLEDVLIPPQVRVDELTVTKCLQGVRNGTSECNIVPLADRGWPSD